MMFMLHVKFDVGHCWAHHCCAAWSEGVIQAEDYSLLNVDKAVFAGLTQVSEHATVLSIEKITSVLYSSFSTGIILCEEVLQVF